METNTQTIQAATKSWFLNDKNFVTDFKFNKSEERAIYDRFVANNRQKNNHFIYYTVVDEDFNYRTTDNEYFWKNEKTLVDRFNEISNYEFIVVDKEFLMIESNNIAKDWEWGRRYIMYVSKEDFDASTKLTHINGAPSKIHPGTKVFKSYEALAEHIEERIYQKAIYIMSEYAFNGLRYLVDEIEMVITDNIETDKELVAHDIEQYNKYLSFAKVNTTSLVNNELVDVEPKSKFFSDFIINAKAKHKDKKTKKEVANVYKIMKITKNAGKLTRYRFAKRSGRQDVYFATLGDIALTIDAETNKIIETSSSAKEIGFDTTAFVYQGHIREISVSKQEYSNAKHIFDELSKITKVQLRTK